MKTLIVLPDNLKKVAEKTGFAPKGYYSQSEKGANENKYIHLFYEGDENLNTPDFCYLSQEIKLSEDCKLW
jgi:hypothetical protein